MRWVWAGIITCGAAAVVYVFATRIPEVMAIAVGVWVGLAYVASWEA